MSIAFHIDFNGQCQEAFEFYAAQLNGNIATMLQFKDSPVATSVPPDWQHKIVHANVSFSNFELAGADVLPEQYQRPKGFYILLGVKSEKEVEKAFNAL